MRVVAIVQARMGSTRLPGKVLMDIGGNTTLCRAITRLSRSTRIDEIVVATTIAPQDDAIVAESKRIGVKWFRGAEEDVLARYCHAADAFRADLIVRITSDCPLIDPAIVDQVTEKCVTDKVDFACNVLPRSFPRGLDTEAFSTAALAKAEKVAHQPYQREHVTPVFYERPDLFRTCSLSAERDCSHHRWTLDTPEDLELIRTIYSHFNNNDDFTWLEVITLMNRLPHLADINAHIVQKPVRSDALVH